MLRKFTFVTISTYLFTSLFASEEQVCSYFKSPDEKLLYRISTKKVNYTEALTQGTLLSIEDPETQDLISAQMAVCNVNKVWLGMRQIVASKLAGEAQQWAWVPDCCHSSCDSAESLQTQYQGCFYENVTANGRGDLTHPSGLASGSVSVTSCIQACENQGYSFAGVHVDNDHQCYCGNTFGRYGSADRCGFTCPGNSSQTCGHNGQNAIYSTKDNGQWTNWADKQPNNYFGFQYCAALLQSENYLLCDESCEQNFKYICEMESEVNGSPCKNMSSFPNANIASNAESCYYISETSSSWYQAKQICRENKGRLAYISSDNEHEFIKNWLSQLGFARIWVGLYRNTFVTDEGENSSYPCYTNFAMGEPQQGSTYVFINSRGSYYWRTTDDDSFLAATITQIEDDSDRTTPDSNESNQENQNNSSLTWLLVAIVVGCMVFIVAVTGVALVFAQKHKERPAVDNQSQNKEDIPNKTETSQRSISISQQITSQSSEDEEPDSIEYSL